ncbi:MAG: TIGR03960 family B12-binding radical SAM protein [Deltaproteobacteria bacterium]|nr:MAG: TIGR03960 family B12-binding radical SAM protein [Deltaproteobacteria bacterium]
MGRADISRSEGKMVEEILHLVSRPSRYLGSEINSIHKDLSRVELKFALIFPDLYEVGMSHLGLQILYQILNQHPKIAAERAYAPGADMEQVLREREIPLFSQESRMPLREFDILGFTLPTELNYSTVLNILDLAGVPLYSRERDTRYPLVIGGGSCVFNPEPLADFFDAFVLGDGEEVILEISEAVTQGKRITGQKEDLLKSLSRIPGVYIPSFFEPRYLPDGKIEKIIPLSADYQKVEKRIVADLDQAPFPDKPIVPFMNVIHDRLNIEIARGCTRGCRFCQAGIIYRPTRERSPRKIAQIAEQALRATGYEELSLLSLSTGDYRAIDSLLTCLTRRYAGEKIAISLPSLRVGSVSEHLLQEIKKVRKTGFTIAPEAGTQRLRDVINKKNTDEEILKIAGLAFQLGWQSIKLYFMIGLPTEGQEDLEAIVDLAQRIKLVSKGKKINLSFSTFIPKPMTPFQWEPQITLDEMEARREFLRREISKIRLNVKGQDPALSLLEGFLARGDRRLAPVILAAFRRGARLDTWSEHFCFDLWKQAFIENGIDPNFYANRRREPTEVFPWDHLDCRVSQDFLWEEAERARQGLTTPECLEDRCHECGVCDFETISLKMSKPDDLASFEEEVKSKGSRARKFEWTTRIRSRFSKQREARFLSHLELISCFYRAIRRSGLPLEYSGGFHPLPKMSFGPPLPVGMESMAEYVDFKLNGSIKPEDFTRILNQELPQSSSGGLQILESKEIPWKSSSIFSSVIQTSYEIPLSGLKEASRIGPEVAIERFLQSPEVLVDEEKKGRFKKRDIRRLVKSMSLRDNKIELILKAGEEGIIKPTTVLKKVFELSEEEASLLRILKTDMLFGETLLLRG